MAATGYVGVIVIGLHFPEADSLKGRRRELAPVEDQRHIAFFMQAAPDSSLAATNRATLDVVKTVEAFPEAKFM